MDPQLERQMRLTRRQFFGLANAGIGTAALAALRRDYEPAGRRREPVTWLALSLLAASIFFLAGVQAGSWYYGLAFSASIAGALALLGLAAALLVRFARRRLPRRALCSAGQPRHRQRTRKQRLERSAPRGIHAQSPRSPAPVADSNCSRITSLVRIGTVIVKRPSSPIRTVLGDSGTSRLRA